MEIEKYKKEKNTIKIISFNFEMFSSVFGLNLFFYGWGENSIF